jgi:hypothetical protein
MLMLDTGGEGGAEWVPEGSWGGTDGGSVPEGAMDGVSGCWDGEGRGAALSVGSGSSCRESGD